MRTHQRQGYNPNGRLQRGLSKNNTNTSKQAVGDATNSSAATALDPSHNGGTPVCLLLKNAMVDVFPELGTTQKQGPLSQRSSRSTGDETTASNGSIFGRMVRQRYLRKRLSHQRQSHGSKLGMNGTWEDHSYLPAAQTTITTSGTKKKRKRKKKKKQQQRPESIAIVDQSEDPKETNGPLSIPDIITRSGTVTTDGKSMMSATDHSLEALDEALKIENEKMIELEANHPCPLLESLPPDDRVTAEECPSQFIDQIKPQDEDLASGNPANDAHNGAVTQIPLSKDHNTNPLSPPKDGLSSHESGDVHEAWKDPLKLPFLVKIEGSDQEHLPCSSANGREKTKFLFHEWIDQCLLQDKDFKIEGDEVKDDCCNGDAAHGPLHKTEKDWNSFLEFCNQCVTSKSDSRRMIRIQDWMDVASKIHCRVCRNETLLEISRIASTNNVSTSTVPTESFPKVVLKSSFLDKPLPQSHSEMDVDSAFDYVALEEGNHNPDANSSGNNIPLNEYDSVDEGVLGSNLLFVKSNVTVDTKTKKPSSNNGKKNEPNDDQFMSLTNLTLDRLDGFIDEWLVAGVDEDRLAHVAKADDEEQIKSEDGFQRIKGHVMDSQLFYTRALEAVVEGLNDMKDELRSKQADLSMTRNLELTGMISMELIEETCDEYLTESILPILTGELSAPFHWCADLQIRVWTEYLSALEKTLKACDRYYEKLTDLSDQNGTVPLIFISAPFRSLYRDLAEEKLQALSQLGVNFATDMQSSSMREFYTRWFSEQRAKDCRSEEAKQLDDNCRNLLLALTQWTKVANAMRISAINDIRRKRLETVFELLHVVVESLGKEYQEVERHFSKEQRKFFTWLLSSITLAHGVKCQMRLIEIDDVVNLTTGILLMWRHVRIMQSRMDESVSNSVLPLPLQKWLLEEPVGVNIELGDSYQSTPGGFYSKCWPGIGGKRRAMGILAGMTYSWLQERCNEWKAELASQELLNGFDLDESSSAVINTQAGSGTKSSKKNKKKKNKNKSTSSVSMESNSSQATPQMQGKSEVIKASVPGCEDDNGLAEDVEILGVSNQATEIEDGNYSELVQAQHEPFEDMQSFEPDLMVEHDGGYISAMDFLCDRLFLLMGESDSENVLVIPG